ncbi:hypothetical protein B5F36_12260 [Anaerofilum sp. An201]|nr:hypothetical protein [Anaerofilum sp. An201]OUP01591.1 hypothetical protein B5F36_12260 [Anaerofilum sp. An201]
MDNIKLANMLKALAEVELQEYEMAKVMEALQHDSTQKKAACQDQIRNYEIVKRGTESYSDIGFWRLLGKTLLVILKTFLILAAIGIALPIVWVILSTLSLGLLYRFTENIVYFSIFLTFAGTIVVPLVYVIWWIVKKHSSKSELNDIRSRISQWEHKKELIQTRYQQQIAQIEQEKVKFKRIAEQIYAKISADCNVKIYYKYNNPVALARFSEYFESGRCTTLEGPHGAYNLYESEVRMNAIIEKLDDVANNLEQVRRGQFILYQGIQMMMHRVNTFSQDVSAACDRMESLEKDIKLQTYYSELHVRQQEYTNYALGVRDYGTGFVTYQ